MSSKIEELRLDIEELSGLVKDAKRPKVSSILSLEMRKLETELVKLYEAEKLKSTEAGATATGNDIKKPATTGQCYDVKVSTYAWDQSDKFVKIFVTLKNVHTLGKDKVTCSFDPTSLELMVKELENRNYFLRIKGFLHEIDDTKSYVKIKNDLVSVYMAKQKPGVEWSHLSSTEQKLKEPKKPTLLDKDGDPEAGLINIMKKMYDDGDDEMKRTIAKLWTENREKKEVPE